MITVKSFELCIFKYVKMNIIMGLIYLIQPCELVGTKRYKIGISNKSDLSRVLSYKKGSRYLCILDCNNPNIIEKCLKDSFNKKYNLIAGNEYYEGDESEILYDFLMIFKENNKLKDLDIKKKDNLKELNDEILKEFCDENIEVKEGEYVNERDVWLIYKKYYREIGIVIKRTTRRYFQKYMMEKYGKMKGKGGYILNNIILKDVEYDI